MIASETLKAGLVLRDNGAGIPSRAYYKLEGKNDDGKWEARHIASGRTSHIDPDRLEGWTAITSGVFCDVDLAGLIGTQVRCDLKWGTVSGELMEVRTVDFTVDQKVVTVPTHFIIAGDVVPIDQITTITVR